MHDAKSKPFFVRFNKRMLIELGKISCFMLLFIRTFIKEAMLNICLFVCLFAARNDVAVRGEQHAKRDGNYIPTRSKTKQWLRANLLRQRQRCCSDKYGQRYVINRPWLGCNGFSHGMQEETGRYHGAPHESGSDRFRSGLANCYPKRQRERGGESTIIV